MRAYLLPFLIALLAGCPSGPPTADPTPKKVRKKGWELRAFTASPLYTHQISEIVPLGHIDPPDQTIPGDYVLLVKADPTKPYPVFAPATGTVTWMLRRSPEDVKILVRVSPNVMYFLDHVVIDDPRVKVGAHVRAGEQIGTARTPYRELGLGVINRTLDGKRFIEKRRYHPATLMSDSPLKYFAEDLRKQMYAKVRREGKDKDGRIDYDRAGHLVGNWFGASIPFAKSMESLDSQLAFVFDVHEPDAVRISIGGSLALRGMYAIGPESPDPRDVTPKSGRVRYRLFIPHAGLPSVGTMLIEMQAEAQLRVQVFLRNADDSDFTRQSRLYRR